MTNLKIYVSPVIEKLETLNLDAGKTHSKGSTDVIIS